jgi:hypothetical protein
MMTSVSTRGFRKNVNPSFYNLRFKPSQGIDNIYFHSWANIHAASEDATKTNRDPSKFDYTNNLFRNDFMEWRMRAADYLF